MLVDFGSTLSSSFISGGAASFETFDRTSVDCLGMLVHAVTRETNVETMTNFFMESAPARKTQNIGCV
jgi:hypothetical protein